jgi:hypothetical protein
VAAFLALCLAAACDLPVDTGAAAGNLRISVPGGETLARSLEPPATRLTLTVSPGLRTVHADAYTPARFVETVRKCRIKEAVRKSFSKFLDSPG